MRQGNEFGQWVDRNDIDITLRVPLELYEDWKKFVTVIWRDNHDGTYTLIPSDKV